MGLGNPGKEYAASRHNVGFLVLDQFAKGEDFSRGKKKFKVLSMEKKIGEETVFLLKPETFMNLSGPAVRDFLSYFSRSPDPALFDSGLEDQVLVVHDDLDLPEGKLRFRARGSSGGHRGVASIIEALGTSDFGRLKIGIGRREGSEAISYVLEPLQGPDEERLSTVAAEAAKTLPVWIREGLEACANRFNSPKDSSPKDSSPKDMGPGSAPGSQMQQNS